MKTILIIEDEQKLNEGIKLALQNPEYRFIQTSFLKEAREILQRITRRRILLWD